MQRHCDFVLEASLPQPLPRPGQAAAQASAPKALANGGCRLLPLLTSNCRQHHPCTCWPASVINIIHIESSIYLLNSSAVVSSLASRVTIAHQQLSSTSSTYLLTSKCHQHHQPNCWTEVVSSIASCVPAVDQQADVVRRGPPGCTPKALGDAACQTNLASWQTCSERGQHDLVCRGPRRLSHARLLPRPCPTAAVAKWMTWLQAVIADQQLLSTSLTLVSCVIYCFSICVCIWNTYTYGLSRKTHGLTIK